MNDDVKELRAQIAKGILPSYEAPWTRISKVESERLFRILDQHEALEKAMEFYADGFSIMDHISGTYTIHETWYQRARETLKKVRGGK